MPEYRVRVAGPHGLHARPAARFVRAVQESGLPVRVDRADGAGAGPVNAASILGVLSLGVQGGEEIVLTCEDEPAGPGGTGGGDAAGGDGEGAGGPGGTGGARGAGGTRSAGGPGGTGGAGSAGRTGGAGEGTGRGGGGGMGGAGDAEGHAGGRPDAGAIARTDGGGRAEAVLRSLADLVSGNSPEDPSHPAP